MADLESRVAMLEAWARAHDHDPLPPAEPEADPDPEPTPEPPPPPAVPSNLRAVGEMRPAGWHVVLTWDGPSPLPLAEEQTPNGLGTVSSPAVRGPLGDLMHTSRYWLVHEGVLYRFPPVPGPQTAPGPAPVPDPDPAPPGGAPRGTVLFVDDFESGGLDRWDAVQTTVTGHDSTPQPVPGHVDLVERPGGGGRCVRFRRPAGARERSELLPGALCDVRAGDIRRISVEWLFPADFPTPRGRWFIVYQQHAGSGPPAFCVEVDRSDRLVVRNNRLNDTPLILGPIDRGRWHRWDLIVRFATDGWVEAYRDGALVVPRTRRSTAPADYAKVGIYTDHDGHDVTTTVFVDRFEFARL